MVTVNESIAINKPQSVVFSFIADPHNDTKWISGIEKVEFSGQLPLKRGDFVKRVAHFMGKEIVYVLEIMEITGSKLLMKSIEGPIPMGVVYAVAEQSKGKSAVHIQVSGEAKGFYKFAESLMSAQAAKRIRKDLKTLKEILES